MTLKLLMIQPSEWHIPAKFQTLEPVNFNGVEIPAGFVTDGATIPGWLPALGVVLLLGASWQWWLAVPAVALMLVPALYPRFGTTFHAALLHDYLLESDHGQWSRANRLFYRQMRADGVCWGRAASMFLACTVYQFIKHIRLLGRNTGA